MRYLWRFFYRSFPAIVLAVVHSREPEKFNRNVVDMLDGIHLFERYAVAVR